jgi:sulfate/thiosulfate transport system ATP-binding protein
VLRVVHLGFEVRLELELGDGSRLPVQLARHEAEALEAAEGDIVWIRGPQPVVAAA